MCIALVVGCYSHVPFRTVLVYMLSPAVCLSTHNVDVVMLIQPVTNVVGFGLHPDLILGVYG